MTNNSYCQGSSSFVMSHDHTRYDVYIRSPNADMKENRQKQLHNVNVYTNSTILPWTIANTACYIHHEQNSIFNTVSTCFNENTLIFMPLMP